MLRHELCCWFYYFVVYCSGETCTVLKFLCLPAGSKDGFLRFWKCGQEYRSLTPLFSLPLVSFLVYLLFLFRVIRLILTEVGLCIILPPHLIRIHTLWTQSASGTETFLLQQQLGRSTISPHFPTYSNFDYARSLEVIDFCINWKYKWFVFHRTRDIALQRKLKTTSL